MHLGSCLLLSLANITCPAADCFKLISGSINFIRFYQNFKLNFHKVPAALKLHKPLQSELALLSSCSSLFLSEGLLIWTLQFHTIIKFAHPHCKDIGRTIRRIGSRRTIRKMGIVARTEERKNRRTMQRGTREEGGLTRSAKS